MADTGPDELPTDPEFHVGCADLPSGLRRVRYFERLRYLEVGGTLYQLPKPSILRRWIRETGEHGRFGLVAPQVITHTPGRNGYARGGEQLTPEQLAQAGGFRASEVVDNAVAQLASAAEIVDASAVVFRSPPDFSPSSSNREAVRTFFAEIATQQRFPGAVRVWEPLGLWEPPVAAQLASELGVVYACDPLSNDPLGVDDAFFASLPCELAYFRIRGLGRARQRFDEFAFESLIELASSYKRVWVVFCHGERYPDAIRLARFLTA